MNTKGKLKSDRIFSVMLKSGSVKGYCKYDVQWTSL